ncbi:MAG: HIT domain-containing protein [Pseudomonadota bacterium]
MSTSDCRFCRANGQLGDAPRSASSSFYMLMSRDPELPGAVMVIPERHVETPFDLTPAEWAEMPDALAAARAALTEFDPDGYTMGWNVGAVAGQTVGHVHLHVIARWKEGPHAGMGLRVPLKHPDGSWTRS